jgi:hypothetical protein
MIAATVKLQVLQNWAKPDSTGTKCFDVAELVLHAGEFAALKVEESRIIEGLMYGRKFRIIKAIDYNEIDRLISPVGWRWKRPALLACHSCSLVKNGLSFS